MDLTKILEIGNKVYTPILGDCTVVSIDRDALFSIKVKCLNGDYNTFTKDGRFYSFSPEVLLFPSKDNRDWSTWESKKKCPFKPFDKVLVRHHNTTEWLCGYFSHLSDSHNRYCASAAYWNECIPYNKETEHLIGTNQDCPEKYKIW